VTDQELLSLAARAHGGLEYVDEMGWIHVSQDGTRGAWWHPLTDDGDALRLAVKLRIKLSFGASEVSATFIVANYPMRSIEKYCNDPYAATRRVIVRAAAAIVKDAP